MRTRDVFLLLFHLLTVIAKLISPSGSRGVIGENLLLKHQLIIHSRSRQRAPNLTTQDRALLGFWTLLMNPRRIARSAIIIKPSTLLSFHKALKKQKYRLLYSPGGVDNEVFPDVAPLHPVFIPPPPRARGFAHRNGGQPGHGPAVFDVALLNCLCRATVRR